MTRPAGPPRIVVDTNLVLSALVFAHGRLAPLRQAWLTRRVRPLVSRATAAELIRVLAYPKFRLSPGEQEELLADYLPCCTTVQIPEPLPPRFRVPACRDPFDLPFLELAIVGRAGALLTGDRHLLELAPEFTCPILTAERFLDTLAA